MNAGSPIAAVTTALLLVGAGAAGAAAPGSELARAAVTPGKYVGTLYDEDDPPRDGWDISFNVKRDGKQYVVKPWGRSVVFYCYPGPTPVMTPFHVPRARITGQGKVVKTWGTPEGTSGVLRLKFRGNQATGRLTYTVGSCSLDQKIKMRRRGR